MAKKKASGLTVGSVNAGLKRTDGEYAVKLNDKDVIIQYGKEGGTCVAIDKETGKELSSGSIEFVVGHLNEMRTSVAKKKATKKKAATATTKKKAATKKKTAAKKATKKKATKKKAAKKKPATRPVLYDGVSVELHDGEQEEPISAEYAKELLGWEEEGEGEDFGSDFLVKDAEGKKVRTFNNTTNREFRYNRMARYKQELLRGRWEYTGESIIIGKTGLILDGQHTLVGLVLAAQEYEQNPEAYAEFIGSVPTLPRPIFFGIDETDQVVNAMNTGDPRTLADVIFRSEYFQDYTITDRGKISRIADHCVRHLWNRTGSKADPYGVQRTHTESISFIERHPKMLECVRTIYEEDKGSKGGINKYVPNGLAAALMYLMAASDSDGTDYFNASTPHEEMAQFGQYDNASNFWVMFAQGDKQFKNVRNELGGYLEVDDDMGSSINDLRAAIICKAWNLYKDDQSMTPAKLTLDFATDENGIRKLAESPTVGGIDFDYDAHEADEVEKEKTKVKATKKKAAKKDDKPKGKGIVEGAEVWVESDEGWYEATVVSVDSKKKRALVTDVIGNEHDVPLSTVQEGEPS